MISLSIGIKNNCEKENVRHEKVIIYYKLGIVD